MTNTLRDTYLDGISRARAAASAYYNGTADSALSDEQYDTLVEAITELGDNNGWTEHVALVEEVAAGAAVIPANEKVTHTEQMLSLKKAQNDEELNHFITKLGFSEASYVVEPKLDGLAISAIYHRGELTQVATRGDSRVGQNVTRNALKATIAGLPHKLTNVDSFEVRGELFITASKFAEAQVKREALTGEKYKLGRTAVSGAIQSKSGTDLAYLELTFAAYDALPTGDGSVLLLEDSYVKRANILEAHGFIPAYTLLPTTVKTAPTILEAVDRFGKLRVEGLDVPTDGIVIKLDSIADRKRLGHGSRHPHWALAYKYEAEVVTTVFKDVVREVGRTGAISYVAQLEPVELDGSVVRKATLNNDQFIANLDLRIGDTVYIRKANDIIPEIIGVELLHRSADAQPYVAPTTCPRCGGALNTTDSVIWRCPNPECSVAERITYAVSRDLLDIDGLSSALVAAFLDEGLIEDVTDLFTLTEKQIADTRVAKKDANGNFVLNQDGTVRTVGTTTAKKLYAAIQGAKKQTLARILSSLGVRFLGRTFGRRLASHFKNFDKVVNATVSQLQQVEGVKEKAQVMHDEFSKKAALIEKYRQVGFEALSAEVAVAAPTGGSGKLTGQSVVVTGAVPGYGRNDVKDLIELHGGNAGSSVSTRTTLLVAPADERTSSKAKKALELNIAIVTPEEFLAMLG